MPTAFGAVDRNLNGWLVETIIGKSLFVAFCGTNSLQHLLVTNTLCHPTGEAVYSQGSC